jgi:hypothetical protein
LAFTAAAASFSETVWIHNPAKTWAVPLPANEGWTVSFEQWDDPNPEKIKETATFHGPSAAIFYVDVWSNPDRWLTDEFVDARANILSFRSIDAFARVASREEQPALEYFFKYNGNQAYDSHVVIVAIGNRAFRLQYLERDGGAERALFERFVAGLEYKPGKHWRGAEALGSAAMMSGPGMLVYSCGGENDTCNCGASNPFPCCIGGNNCNVGGSAGNCTWYAWHRGCCAWGVNVPARGHAKTWADACRGVSGYTVTTTPAANSIAVRKSGTYGHVAWVESIDGDYLNTRDQSCCQPSWGTRSSRYHKSYFDEFIYRGSGPPPDPCSGSDGASFVSESWPYDNDTVQPGQTFTKRWTMRNSGSSTWRNSCNHKWAFDGGERFGAPEYIDVGGDVAPGQNKDWHVSMRAPTTPGTYQGWWRTDRYGTGRFGDRVWIKVVVANPTGSLRIDIEPAEARSAGAQWRVGGGSWRNSGETVSGLSPGTHTVSFNDIPNWSRPGDFNVTIAAGQTTTGSGTYQRHTGSLRVDITPSAAVSAGAQWRIDGGAWYNSGATVSGLAVGSYTVSFKPLSGWHTPGNVGVTIHHNQTTTAGGAYNRSPFVNSPGDKFVHVGQLLQFTVTGGDSDGDPINLSCSGQPAGATFVNHGASGTFSFTPAAHQAGQSFSVTFTATDNRNHTGSASITLRVGAPPVLAPPGDRRVLIEQLLQFTVSASEPDGNAVTFSMSGAPPGATLTGSGNSRLFSYTPPAAAAGQVHTVTFTASDPDGQDQKSSTIIVGAPPSFAPVTPKTVVEDDLLTFPVTASDPNNDAISISMSNHPSGAALSGTGGTRTFSFTPNTNHGGSTYTVRFTAQDQDGVAHLNVPITVRGKPRIAPIGDRRILVGDILEFRVTATDPESNVISYAATGLPPSATFAREGEHHIFRFIPIPAEAGAVYPVVFTASDLDGSRSATVRVTVAQPPIIAPIANRRVLPGDTLSVTVTVTDANSDPITLSVTGAPPSATLSGGDGQYVLAYTPASNEQGAVFNVVLTASDIDGVAQTGFRIVVGGMPIIEPIPDGRTLVGVPIAFPVIATEPNGDAIDLRAENLPDHATFGSTNGNGWFAFTPTSNQAAGVYPVRFIARDIDGAYTQTVVITVGVPVKITPIAPARVRVGHSLIVPVHAHDANGDPVTLTASNLPAHAVFGATNHHGVLQFSPVLAQVGGVFTVTVHAVDRDGADQAKIIATVGGPPIPHPVSDRRVVIGRTIEIQFSFDEPNGDAVSQHLTGAPQNASFNPLTGAFAFTPEAAQAGDVRTLTYTVSDIDGTNSVSFKLTVGAPPVLAPLAPVTLPELETIRLTVSASDANNDAIALSVSNAPANSTFVPTTNGAVFTFTPDAAQGATVYTPIFFAADQDGVASQAVAITVLDDDAYEQNDTWASAFNLRDHEFRWLSSLSGSARQADDDWYEIDISPGFQRLVVTASLVRAHGNIRVELYDAAGQSGRLVAASAPAGNTEIIDLLLPSAGAHRLRVTGDNTGQPYDLWWDDASSYSANCAGPDDAYEENDTPAAAFVLPPATPLSAIAGTGRLKDDDWYKLVVPPGLERVVVTCRFAHAQGDIDIELYDATGNIVADSYGLTDEESIDITVPAPGIYRVLVFSVDGAICSQYELVWNALATTNRDIFLAGNFLFLPVNASDRPGRFLSEGGRFGGRYNPNGGGGALGRDFWAPGVPLFDTTVFIGTNASILGDRMWSNAVVTLLETGATLSARVEGEPFAQLRFTREVRFPSNGTVITVRDTLSNSGSLPIADAAVFDIVDPDPDYADYGLFETSNDVDNVLMTNNWALAIGARSGLMMGLAGLSTNSRFGVVGDGRLTPASLRTNLLDPDGAWADRALGHLAEPGLLPPQSSRVTTWFIAFSTNREAQRAALVSAMSGAGEADIEVLLDAASDAVALGEDLAFAARVRNLGPQPVSAVTGRLVFAAGARVRAVSGSGTWSVATGAAVVVLWTVPALNVGEDRTLNVAISHDAPGAFDAELIAHSGMYDPHPPNNTARVSYACVLPSILVVEPAGTSIASGDTYDFGAHAAASRAEIRLLLTNSSAVPLLIDDWQIAGAHAAFFSADSIPDHVAPRAAVAFDLIYAPSQAGAHEAALTLHHNAAMSPYVLHLRGRTPGAIALEPGALFYAATFGDALVGAQSILVSNSGWSAITWTNTTAYDPPAASWFEIAPPTGALAVGGAAVVTARVNTAGLSAGVYTASNRFHAAPATNSPRAIAIRLELARAPQTLLFAHPGAQLATNRVGLAARASSGLPVLFTVVSGPGVLAGGTNLTFTGGGEVVIAAEQPGDANWLPAETVHHTLAVGDVLAAIVVDNLRQVYDGSPRAVQVHTDPPGLPVTVRYNGSLAPPVTAGVYVVEVNLNHSGYVGQQTETLIVERAPQQIDFNPPAVAIATSSLPLVAQASSGLPVDFAIEDGPAFREGNALLFTESGLVRIRADQPGDANWLSAPTVTATIRVDKATARIALSELTQRFQHAACPVRFETEPANLNAIITYNSEAEPPVEPGVYAVHAVIHDPRYAGETNAQLTILKGIPVIHWYPDNLVYGERIGPNQMNAVSDRPGRFIYTPGSNTLLPAGSHLLRVEFIPHESNLYEITSSEVEISVAKAPQHLVFDPLPDRIIGDPPFTLLAGGGETEAPIIFESLTPETIAVNGNQATILGPGLATIRARKAGDENYEDGEAVRSFRILRRFVIHASAAGAGRIEPSGDIPVVEGASTNFLVTADRYFHIFALYSNDTPIAAAAGRPAYTALWEQVMSSGTIFAVFAENRTARGTPERWLAAHGWTNDFEQADDLDADADGVPTWQEAVANTDPTNRLSVFQLRDIRPSMDGPRLILRWSSESNRWYTVWRRAQIGAARAPVAGGLPATPPENVHTTIPSGNLEFYEVEVIRPD